MKASSLHNNKNQHPPSAYLTKRLMVSSSKIAVRSAVSRAIDTAGYLIKAQDGWIVRESKDGTTQKISKYKSAKSYRFAID